MIPVIALDGVGGSGKTTIAGLLATKLGWNLLVSGALYRVLAWQVTALGEIKLTDKVLKNIIAQMQLSFISDPVQAKVIIELNNQIITDSIYTEKCAKQASDLAKKAGVRKLLVSMQHDFRRHPGLIADGRDMGSVIFPDAKLKVFLTADLAERAKRRYYQLKNQNKNVSIGALMEEIRERDAQDSNRSIAPLKPADGAIIVDTTDMSIQEVVENIHKLWRTVVKG